MASSRGQCPLCWGVSFVADPTLLSHAAIYGNLSTLLIPIGTTPVHFFADYRESPHNNELGYFFMDGPDGRITNPSGKEPPFSEHSPELRQTTLP